MVVICGHDFAPSQARVTAVRSAMVPMMRHCTHCRNRITRILTIIVHLVVAERPTTRRKMLRLITCDWEKSWLKYLICKVASWRIPRLAEVSVVLNDRSKQWYEHDYFPIGLAKLVRHNAVVSST